MLSILIPTYNYSVLKLVQELHNQAEEADIDYEILVYDDASPLPLEDNEKINLFSNCQYKLLNNNIGRSSIRNLLAKDASYRHILFLDADTFPMNKDFIATYLPFLNTETQVVYGGIAYQEQAPETNNILRWKYGKSREALDVTSRNKRPYLRFLTLNFLIKKSVFKKVRFNEDIPNARHEDTLFAQDLKKNSISLKHINNPVLHLGLDSNADFLVKSMASVATLHDFLKEGRLKPDDVKLTQYAVWLKKYKLETSFMFFYKNKKSFMERNLSSSNPSLILFDLYRLGYFLELKIEDHV